MIEGRVKLTGGEVLDPGDVACLITEPAVSFSSEEHSEVLLLDSLERGSNGAGPL